MFELRTVLDDEVAKVSMVGEELGHRGEEPGPDVMALDANDAATGMPQQPAVVAEAAALQPELGDVDGVDPGDTRGLRRGAVGLAMCTLAVVALALEWPKPKPSKSVQRLREAEANGASKETIAKLQNIVNVEKKRIEEDLRQRGHEQQRDEQRRTGRGQTSDGAPGNIHYEGSGN